VNVHVFATDYDGTIAEGDRVAAATARALERVRASGRKLLLVTGRMLPDLQSVCPETDQMFDAVVAENGAVVYFPERRELRVQGDGPEPALLEALQRRGVRFSVGSAIVATHAPFAEAALAAIREAGVERTLVFNRDALMLLPAGVNKGTGLAAALATLQLSPHNMVGIGDAENDHAFLALSECAVAVGDAVPALRERADHVTRAPAAAGVVEFIEEHVLRDLVDIVPRLARHHLALGEQADGPPVTVASHGSRLLIIGPSGSGKSTLTGVLAERVLDTGRSLVLIDPEGDYRTLADLEGVLVFGGKGEQALPGPDELEQLVRHPVTSLVLDLSAMGLAEKVAYATRVLAVVAAVRSSTGLPHWLIIDEAHHLLPAARDGSSLALPQELPAAILITVHPEMVSPDALAGVDTVLALGPKAREAVASFCAAIGRKPPKKLPKPDDEQVLVWRRGSKGARLVTATKPRQAHKRHTRKYAEGNLDEELSFYFRGPDGALNLRAHNLQIFLQMAEGVDDETWEHHLRRGDYSDWFRDVIKDDALAKEAAAIEANKKLRPAASRAKVKEAVERRYTAPASEK
jgi:hydroxymethylpyrimidine pyrophosphatase-like HAD family hydrolase/energy-coupling factor transporter ATP-binding protein EcfA2